MQIALCTALPGLVERQSAALVWLLSTRGCGGQYIALPLAGQGQGVVELRAAPNGLGQQGRVTAAGHGSLLQPLGGFHQSHFGKLPLAARLRVLIDRHSQGAEQPHDGQHTE